MDFLIANLKFLWINLWF